MHKVILHKSFSREATIGFGIVFMAFVAFISFLFGNVLQWKLQVDASTLSNKCYTSGTTIYCPSPPPPTSMR